MPNIKDFKKFDFTIDYEDIIMQNTRELGRNIQKSAKSIWGGRSPYASGWSAKLKKVNKKEISGVVYNKDQYQLTHLLEFGHVVWNSKSGARTKPREHILNNYKKQKEKFIEQMEHAKIK